MLHKRPDGFHEIASLFQAISLGDFLTIRPNDGTDHLTCTNPHIPTDQTNLILRAAHLFRAKTGIQRYFSFALDKRIPIEAGLGGGSSNAATTLWGLNEILGTEIEVDILREWAAELGSDVPFFLSSGRAYAEGKGEILTSQTPIAATSIWIAKPSEGLSTPDVYKQVVIEQLTKRDPREALHSHCTDRPIFFNDLEEPAFQLAPQLKDVKRALLQHGFEQVHMTGSGTAFFCFGSVNQPRLPNLQFFPAHFIHRDEDWYKLPA